MRAPIVTCAALLLLFLAGCTPPADTEAPDGEATPEEATGSEATGGDATGEQEAAPAPPAGGVPAPDPADVASMDAILTAVYEVISGPAAEPRDWDRFRSLFLPEARLVSVGGTEEGEIERNVMTPEQFIESSDPYLRENGFFESEIGRVAEEYRHIAHVFSAYESRREPDAEPFARGINSFQLLDDGERWWIVTILWNPETAEAPIPDRYLTG